MKPRILVVDDDTALAEMLTIVLRGEGFEPFVVGDGTQALGAVPLEGSGFEDQTPVNPDDQAE